MAWQPSKFTASQIRRYLIVLSVPKHAPSYIIDVKLLGRVISGTSDSKNRFVILLQDKYNVLGDVGRRALLLSFFWQICV
jgi:hypothetical protein